MFVLQGNDVINADSDARCCRCLQTTMTDCVIAADGLSYERAAITSWLQHSNVSPITGKPLLHQRLVPNILLRNVIETHINSQGNAEGMD